MHVVSIHTPLFGYHLEPAQGRQLARDVNDEIAAMTRQWPQQFAGLATLPVQDVKRRPIDELDRAVNVLGLKGAELDTVVNGANWDEPQFLPLFKAAGGHGRRAVLSPPAPAQSPVQGHRPLQCGQQHRRHRRRRADRRDPHLRRDSRRLSRPPVCIAHGGGPACFGMGRLDHGWRVRSEARQHIQKPPSAYLRRLYYDCVTHGEAGLRLLLDHVGADRVVLGSDWPFVGWNPSPVAGLQGLRSLTAEEKNRILWQNLEKLLAL